MTAAANLNTATFVRCPTCERIVPVTQDAEDQIMCPRCDANIGFEFATMWEAVFDTFYDGSIPAAYVASR